MKQEMIEPNQKEFLILGKIKHMDLQGIISISGRPGLFKIVTQGKSNVIVESLIDKKRLAINATQNVSLLENIAIYTYEEDMPLQNVFNAMFEKTEGKEAISHKENDKKLIAFFEEVLPNYDAERVYVSNIKKVIQWFNILVNAGMVFKSVEEKKEEA